MITWQIGRAKLGQFGICSILKGESWCSGLYGMEPGKILQGKQLYHHAFKPLNLKTSYQCLSLLAENRPLSAKPDFAQSPWPKPSSILGTPSETKSKYYVIRCNTYVYSHCSSSFQHQSRCKLSFVISLSLFLTARQLALQLSAWTTGHVPMAEHFAGECLLVYLDFGRARHLVGVLSALFPPWVPQYNSS